MDEEQEKLQQRVKEATRLVEGPWECGNEPATKADLARGLTYLGAPVTSLGQTVASLIGGDNEQARATAKRTLVELVEFTEFVSTLVTNRRAGEE